MLYSAHGDDGLQQSTSSTLVLATMFLSFALEFLPWSVGFSSIRPVFPVVVLLYWAIHKPALVNYTAAFFVGLLIDLSNQAPLGFNALACSVMVLFTNSMIGRFVLLSAFGQALNIFFILVIGQFAVLLLSCIEVQSLRLFSEIRWRLFWPSISAACLWLFLPLLIGHVRRLLLGLRDGRSD